MSDNRQSPKPQSDITSRLISLVQNLLKELQSAGGSPEVELHNVLDLDLGIDSLSRVELVLRIEREFEIQLPEQTFATAETVDDLRRAIANATPGTAAIAQDMVDVAKGDAGSPENARTLLDMLVWHVERHPERPHIRFLQSEQDDQVISYGDLYARAIKTAAALQHLGVLTGDRVAIMLPTDTSYFDSFFGIVLAGAIPVPIYPPVRRHQLTDHLIRQSKILNNCQPRILITLVEAKNLAHLLQAQVQKLRHVVTAEELLHVDARYQRPSVNENDIAFLQYTSGSTGTPKGVVLTHQNLLANIRADGEHIKANDQDVFVSWLPLYHDMGLIGAWLGSLYFAVPLVCMSPLTFLSRPRNWLLAIHRYRGTLSAAPNFAYELCLSKIRDKDIEGLDLSSWRIAFNGAEAVSAHTIERFADRFAPFGFRSETMYPVYGLAECTVGLAFPPLGKPPTIDRINRDMLMQQDQAVPAIENDPAAIRFVASGRPLSGHEIRIVNQKNHELPERHVGHLQFRGPSATSGYYHQSAMTRELYCDDWLNSGDRGYKVNGDIYITGRQKDMIIRAGQNIYPEELEEKLGKIKGVRNGRVAVFGSNDADSGTEGLIVVAETRLRDDDAKEQLTKKIGDLTMDLLGTPADDVVLAPAGTVLKTSSGKLRRGDCRTLYETNAIGKPRSALWWQLTRLGLRGIKPQILRAGNFLSSHLYAAWCWTIFGSLAGISWLALQLLPSLRLRWGFIHNAVRLVTRITAIPLHVTGHENILTGKPCVIVANHASYLDGIVLVGAISQPFSFVAKAELKLKPSVSRLLNRIDVLFVERTNLLHATEDARRIADAARNKNAVMFFPEGTFKRTPGILPFRMGAFVTAMENNTPVIPIAIQGTRSILRADSWFPRRGNISITIGKPIYPESTANAQDERWTGAVKLRRQAREFIAHHYDDPDVTDTVSRNGSD